MICATFPELRTYADWLAMYRKDVRVFVAWGDLPRFKPAPKRFYATALSGPTMWLPWYSKGSGGSKSWVAGKPQEVRAGWSAVVLRVPAVVIRAKHGVGTEVVVLDGCHRLAELRPVLVVIDALEGSSGFEKCFLDSTVHE